MYNEIVGQQIKIIHKDGDRTSISVGLLQEYDSSIQTLKMIKSSGKILFIHATSIEKLEVLQ